MISPLMVPALIAAALIAIISFWATHGLNKSEKRDQPHHEPRPPRA